LVEADMPKIVELIDEVLMNKDSAEKIAGIKAKVNTLMGGRPLFAY
jgi:glycine hydroxymethyltransferase